MRQAVILLCLFVATAHGATISAKSGVHSDLCSWGPQYWCSSDLTAERCGKVQYCTSHDWTRKIITDERCARLQEIIKYIRQDHVVKVMRQISDREAAMVLARVCSADQDKDSRLQCKNLVTDPEILPKLIKLTFSKLPAQSVAVAIGGCKREEPKDECDFGCERLIKTLQVSLAKGMTLERYMMMFKPICITTGIAHRVCEAMAHDKFQMFMRGIYNAVPSQLCAMKSNCVDEKPFPRKVKEPFDECDTCKDVVSEIRSLDRNPEVQAAIRGLMEDACSEMGEFEELCDRWAKQGLTFIAEIIATELEPEVVCERFHLCTQSESKVLAAPKEKKSYPKCSFCSLVTKEMDKLLASGKEEAEVLSVMDKFCEQYPSISQECKKFTADYGKQIIKLLAGQLEPENVCGILQLCEDKGQSKVVEKKLSKKSVFCEVCDLVMKEVDSVLGSNATEQEIMSLLDEVCDRLPPTISKTCETFVEQYTPIVIQLLVANLDPNVVCPFLGLCKNSTALATIKSVPVPKLHKDNNELCELCEYIVTFIDGLLRQNSTEAEVKALLNAVCDELPSPLKTSCQSLLKEYFPLIESFLEKGFPPKQACQSVNMCPASSVELLRIAKLKDSSECVICEYMITEMTHFLSEKSTQAEIDDTLEKVCDMLPVATRPKCVSIIETYGPLIVSFIVDEVEPRAVCESLTLCAPSKGKTVKPFSLSSKTTNGEFCEVCKFVIKTFDQILREKSTEQEIQTALNQVCQMLPDDIKNECDSFVNQYTPEMILVILSYSSEEVCQKIGTCPQQQRKNVVTSSRKLNANELCPICEFVIKELDGVLNDNSTEKEIEAALEQVCGFLPASLKSECDMLVETYTPTLIQLLVAYSPKDVCQLLGLCTKSQGVARSQVQIPRKEKDTPLCPICEFVIKELDGVLNDNSTEKEIEAALEQVCGFLPASLKSECDMLVETYTPTLIQLLVAYSPKDVCQLLGLCTKSQGVARSQVQIPRKEKDTPLCPICEFVIKELDGVLNDNSTEKEIEAALEQVCGFLPASLKSECDMLVETYTPTLIQLLVAYSPKDVCQLLGLCTKSQGVARSQVQIPRKEKDTPLCPICEFVIKELDGVLNDNSTEKEIEAALEQVCGFLPASLKSECDMLVETYTPTLIQLLVAYSPKDVCQLLGLCTKSQGVARSQVQIPRKEKDTPLCTICEFAMSELDNVLSANNTEQEIESALEQVCQLLPATVKAECDNLVKQFTPTIIQLLVSNLQPKQICTALDLCTNTKHLPGVTRSQVQIPRKEKDTPLCTICEFAMSELDNVLSANNTEQEIEAALEQVCQLLPATVKAECDNLVKQFTPTIIQLLVSNLQPKQICTALGLCTNTTHLPVVAVSQMQIPRKDSELCTICELAMSELDKLLKENGTVQNVEAALEKVCQLLPSTLKDQCDKLVEQYAPFIIQILAAEIQPKQVCASLGLCTKTTHHPALPSQSLLPDYNIGKQKSMVCTICYGAMQGVDLLLNKKDVQNDIIKALEAICNLLPSQDKAKCLKMVPMYTNYAIQLIEDDLTPGLVCDYLKLCDHAAAGVTDIRAVSTITKEIAVKKNELCTVCVLVFTTVDQMLTSNSTETEAIAALDKVCDFLPPGIKAQCEPFVKLYLPYVLELVVQQLKPDEICHELNLCTSLAVVKPKTLVTNNVGDSELCSLCEYTLQYLVNILSENSTEAEIEAALETMCSVMPKEFQDSCDALVKEFTPEIIYLILQRIEPKEICVSIGLCNSHAPKRIELKKKELVNGEACEICETVLTYVDSILKSNTTQEEIIDVLTEVCNILPDKSDCEKYIRQYFDEIVDLLLDFPPSEICRLINLCPSKGLSELKKRRFVSGPACEVCETVLTYLDSILKNKALQQGILDTVTEVCNILPDKSDCVKYIHQYFDEIVNLLLDFPPSELCKLFNLCPTSKFQVSLPGANNGVTCELCELVIQELQKMISSTSTEDEIESALEKVCGFLPSSVRTECDDLVKSYTPALIKILMQETRPRQVCIELNVCTNAQSAITKSRPMAPNSETCELCTTVVGELDEMLKDKITQEELRNALDFICQRILPSSFTDECVNLVNTYEPLIIGFITQMSPKELCTLMGACNSSAEILATLRTAALQKFHVEATVETCEVCSFAVAKFENFLSNNSTKREFRNALEFVCHKVMPSYLSEACDNFVAIYEPWFINIMTQEMPPKDVCTLLGLCKPSARKTVASSPLCPICQEVAKYLDQMLMQNSTQKDFEEAVEKVCSLLPTSFQSECVTFVDMYSPQIVDFLVKEMNPSVICVQLNFCDAKAKKIDMPKSEENNILTCDLCKMVVNELKSKLSSQATEAEIEAALKEVCSLLPSAIETECNNFVNTYGSLIINFILQDLSADEICQKLGLCSSSVKNMPKSEETNILTCDLCKMVVNELKSKLSSQATEAEIEAALKEVCSLLPSAIETECNNFVNTYGSLIINFILQDLSADEICQKLGLCSSSVKMTSVVESKPVNVQGSGSCVLCELVMDKLKSMVTSKTSEAEIKSALEKVCNILPDSFKDECDRFVDTYASKIIHLIMSDVSAEQICTMLKLCSSSAIRVDVTSVDGCTLCKFALEEVKGLLEQKSSVMEATAAIEYECRQLPARLRTPCLDLAIMFGPNLVRWLTGKIDPHSMCQLIRVCPPRPPMEVQVKAAPKSLKFASEKSSSPAYAKDMPNCSSCKFALYELQTAVHSSYWKTETAEILNLVCERIKQWPDVCKYMVKENLPSLISETQSFRFPIEFCQELKMCESPRKATVKLSDGESCGICHEVVRYLDASNLVNPSESKMNRACTSLVPEPHKPYCLSLVRDYAPMLMNLMKKNQDPFVVCQIVNVCPKMNARKSVITY